MVTCACAGDQSNQIHMVGYQVSNQCAALVHAQLLTPVEGRPELAYIRPRDRPAYPDQYVPDVQYKVSSVRSGFARVHYV
jgi:nuclear protein localization family protein 4